MEIPRTKTWTQIDVVRLRPFKTPIELEGEWDVVDVLEIENSLYALVSKTEERLEEGY